MCQKSFELSREIGKVESCPILKKPNMPLAVWKLSTLVCGSWCLLGSFKLIMHEEAWQGVLLLSLLLITPTAKTHTQPVLQAALMDVVTSAYSLWKVCSGGGFVFIFLLVLGGVFFTLSSADRVVYPSVQSCTHHEIMGTPCLLQAV